MFVLYEHVHVLVTPKKNNLYILIVQQNFTFNVFKVTFKVLSCQNLIGAEINIREPVVKLVKCTSKTIMSMFRGHII